MESFLTINGLTTLKRKGFEVKKIIMDDDTIGVRCDLYYDIRCSVYNLTESKSKQNRALIIAGFKV